MIVQSKRIYIASHFMPCQLEITEGKITGVLPYNEKSIDIDYDNLRIVPGFIDIHTHGAMGFDANDNNHDGLLKWLSYLPKEGVTSVLPTTITQNDIVLKKALKNIAETAITPYSGAEILGIHFEGPFLNTKYNGAQPKQYIIKPSIEKFKEYQQSANGMIKLITLAPENDANFTLTKYCHENKISVSIGHSAATYEDTVFAISNGAKSFTHIYNAMPPYKHREPGLIGAAMHIKEAYTEIICDGIHVDLTVVSNLYTLKGQDRVIMITDSIKTKGFISGVYAFGGQEIEVTENDIAIIKGTKTLAGSSLKMNIGLKNIVEKAMVPFDFALNSCTINPARLLNIDDKKGRLYTGYDADFVVLSDDYNVYATYGKGKVLYSSMN